MALLETLCHWGCVLSFEKAHARPSPSVSLYFSLSDRLWIRLQLSVTSPALSACCHATCHDDYGLSLLNYKPAPIKCFSLYSCHGYSVFSQQQKTFTKTGPFFLSPNTMQNFLFRSNFHSSASPCSPSVNKYSKFAHNHCFPKQIQFLSIHPSELDSQ